MISVSVPYEVRKSNDVVRGTVSRCLWPILSTIDIHCSMFSCRGPAAARQRLCATVALSTTKRMGEREGESFAIVHDELHASKSIFGTMKNINIDDG